jgi:prepilin-type N-terminal cleavage/methylation domain-containing protein
MRFSRGQRGMTMIELMVVMAVLSVLLVAASQRQLRELEKSSAQQAGNELAMVVAGVTRFLAQNPTTPSAVNNGVTWLKSTACGGPNTTQFVPCYLPNTTVFGNLGYRTTITNTAGVITAVVRLDPVLLGGILRSDLSGEIGRKASDLVGANGGFGFAQVRHNIATATVEADIFLNPLADPWLLVNGLNQMNADITFNPVSANRDINNAAAVNADSLNLTGEARATIFRDTNDPFNFFLDPNQNSILSGLTLRGGTLTMNNPAGSAINVTNRLTISTSGNQRLLLNPNAGSGDVEIGGSGGSGNLRADDVFVRARNAWLTDLIPNIILKNTYRVVHNNSIPKPSCPGSGQPKIYMSDQVQLVDNRPPTFYVARATATDNGSVWRAVIGHYGTGGFTSSGTAWAIATTACYYP